MAPQVPVVSHAPDSFGKESAVYPFAGRMQFDDVLVKVTCTQLTQFFQVIALVSIYPVSSGFENGYIFCARFIQPEERNFTGRDSFTCRTYLKYVINLTIM